MPLQNQKTKQWYQRALQVMPLGVSSNFRYWGQEDTLVIQRAKGAYLWDMDDHRYIDYRLGFGPIILGHAHEQVNQAVAEAIQEGTLFAWTTPAEVKLCEQIVRMTGVQKVRLTNSGTEATMNALRIARAYTNREKFIKFEGHYHGSSDYFLFSTASTPKAILGSYRSPVAVPMSSGIPKSINEYVIILPFNDLEILEKTIRERWGEIAGVIVEPIMGNVGGLMPQVEFLSTLRRFCDEYGIVLIFDEVKTGFRIAKGGAQEFFNLQADLVTYAKALGNGYPIAAVGGKDEIMQWVAPGEISVSGTYNGNVVGVAAALATLEILESQPVFDELYKIGKSLQDGLQEILTDHGIPHAITGLPPMFGIFLGSDRQPVNYREYLMGDSAFYSRIVYEMVKRGAMPDIDGREPWFLCAALKAEDVQETLNIFNDAVKVAKQ